MTQDPNLNTPLPDEDIEKSRKEHQNVDSDGRERQPTQQDSSQQDEETPSDLNRGTRSEK